MKFLYASGYTENAIMRHGAVDPQICFRHKPFTPDTLVRKVRETLDADAATAAGWPRTPAGVRGNRRNQNLQNRRGSRKSQAV